MIANLKRTLILPCLAVALLVASGGATTLAQSASAFGDLAGQSGAPIQVTADRFDINEGARTATFSGNVEIVQEGFSLSTETVDVLYGEGGTSDLISISTRSQARIRFSGQTARANRAVYDAKARRVRLSGNVEVTGALGTINGEELTINLVTGETSFSSTSGGGRVTGVFSVGE